MRTRLALLAVTAAVLAPAAARAEACIVRGERVVLEDVVVGAGDDDRIDLDGTRARAQLPATEQGSATVVVDDAVRFRGRRRNIWYTVARPVTTAHGMVVLQAGAQVVKARFEQGEVLAAAVMRFYDVLPGENKDPDETIRGLRIPCAALTLDQPPDDESDDSAERPESPDESWWLQKKPSRNTTLRAAPRPDAPSITLATIVEGQRFTFRRVAQQGDWMRVSRSGSGVTATGWIRRAALEPADGPEGSSGGCTGDHGSGLGGRGWGGRPPVTVYEGPGRLRVGAVLDFNGWSATVQRPDGFEVWVYDWGGRRLAEVKSIPGVALRGSIGPDVSVRDVTYPLPGNPVAPQP